MDNKLQDQIERYLFHEMNEEEERNFASRVDNDADLKKEVELTAMIIAATTEVGKQQDVSKIELLKQASADEINKLTSRKKHKPILKLVYWSSASVAVIILAFITHRFYSTNNANEQLFAAYYTPYHDDTGAHRGGSTLSDNDAALLMEAVTLYTNEKYDAALDLFNKISDNLTDDIAVYKAICLLETGKTEQAISILSESIERNGYGWEYYQDARWYLALSLVKSGHLEEAKIVLEQIAFDGRVYADKANELLNRLTE